MPVKMSGVALSAFLATTQAQAATMTFNSLTDPIATSYSENGITATGNGHMGMYSSGNLHIDDGGTSAPSRVTFTMAAGAFTALSFDIRPIGFYLEYADPDGNLSAPGWANVQVQGFSGIDLVSSLMFDMGKGQTPYTVTLGSVFSNLTALAISIVYPDWLLQNLPKDAYAWCDSPCSHFEIDNVTLTAVTPAAVPLPAGLPLAASGLALLGGLALRRRSRR